MHEDSSTSAEWLTVNEVAAVFECNRAVIYSYIRRGLLGIVSAAEVDCPGRHFNQRYYVSRQEAQALLDERRPALQEGDWLSLSDAAAHLGMSIDAVKTRLSHGDLRSVSWLEVPVGQRTGRQRSSRTYLALTDLEAFRKRLQAARFLTLPSHHVQTDLAYAAGLMDGEGCVSIIPANAQRCGYYTLTVCIVNTHQPVIHWLQETLGGGVTHRAGAYAHYRDQWHWRVQSGRAYQFLRLVVPYLHIKRAQALLAIRFHERLIDYDAGRDRLLSAAEITWRQEQVETLHLLNAGHPPMTG